MSIRTSLTLLSCCSALVFAAVGCGGDDDSSSGDGGALITADGSSTVGPFTTRAAEDWKADGGGDVTVGISGTGGDFERFCAGETDISNASRQIDEEEVALCEEGGVEYVELQVATDALTNVVNTSNDFATCLTVEQLAKIWGPGSKISNWNQVDPSFPDLALKLYGPGTDSGTFDYFTDVINGDEGASRTDFSASEDDNVIVQGVAGTEGGLGYLGFSYFEENQDTLKAVQVNGGSGCVGPSVEAAQDGSYEPLARPLFMYVKLSSLSDNQSVSDFVTYTLENAETIATEAQFVPLSPDQIAEQQQKLEGATS
ncbi:MAG TPA: PstS family phosphate ABC transporter substrate-binding protein [Gaiellaceae bacterium]|nr:PstS family phosphate ABC transporter substrate-binding protein [Gaiellaceae bacterium]